MEAEAVLEVFGVDDAAGAVGAFVDEVVAAEVLLEVSGGAAAGGAEVLQLHVHQLVFGNVLRHKLRRIRLLQVHELHPDRVVQEEVRDAVVVLLYAYVPLPLVEIRANEQATLAGAAGNGGTYEYEQEEV